MKKYNIFTLVLVLMLGLTSTLMNPTEVHAEDYGKVCEFEDVRDESAYFYKAVYWAKVTGVTTGRSKKTENGGKIFDPYATCTRGEIVTYLWRAAGKPSPKASECKFDDVSSNSYYCKAVQWAYEQGITTGRSKTNNFDPNATCTRREIVTFLWRYAGKPEPKSSKSKFTDNQDKKAYYYKAVQWAAEQKISTGTSASNYKTFDILGQCTRAMSVTFLYRYCAPTFWNTNEADIEYHFWEAEQVLVKEAYDEKVLTKKAYDEKVLVNKAYDEKVLVTAAYDEQKLVTAAYDEEVEVEETVTETHEFCKASVCGIDLTEAWENGTNGADKYKEAGYRYQDFLTLHGKAHALAGEGNGYTNKDVTVTKTVTKTVHHDAVYETVHHDAVYKTVHHDAQYEMVHHDAQYETAHHDAVYETVYTCSNCDATK